MAINLGNILFGIQAVTSGFQQAISQVNAAKSAVISAMNQQLNAYQAAAAAANQHTSAVGQLSRAASLVTGPLSGIAYRITVLNELLGSGAMKLALYAAGTAAIAVAAYKLSEASVKNEIDLNRSRMQLFALTGSMDEANQEMQNLMKTADKFGVPFDEVSHNFVRISLAARGTALEGQGVRDVFEQIVAYASNMALTQEQLTSILGHTETMLSRGRVQWREMQQVWNRDIPNAASEAAKAMGVTRDAFDRMVKRGDVLSADFLPKFFAQLNKSYNIDASKPVDNLSAAYNRLLNAQTRTLSSFNDVIGASDRYHAGLDKLTATLESVRSNMREIVLIAGTAGAALLAALASNLLVTGLLATGAAVRALAVAVTTLNVASLGSGIGAFLKLATVIGAAVFAYKELNDNLGTGQGEFGKNIPHITVTKAGPTDTLEETAQQRQMRLTMKELQQFVSESNRQYAAMKEGPQSLADVMESIDLEKKIEGWRDKMERAGFTAGEMKTQIDNLTSAYTRLRDAQKADKEFVTNLQLIDATFQDLGTKSVNTFVDALSKGTNMAQAFGTMWVQVLDDIYKKILTFAVINPILNTLFGGNAQTLTSGTPGTAVGGLFGKLFGSLFGGVGTGLVNGGGVSNAGALGGFGTTSTSVGYIQHAGSNATRFGFFPSSLWSGAPRLHNGLQADEYPAILQSGEQVIPRGGSVGGGGGIEVHVHEAPGQPTQQIASRTPDGRNRLDIMMKQVALDAFQTDILKGGQTATLLERRYSLDRTKGLAS